MTALWLQFAPMLVRLEPVAAPFLQPVVMLLRWLAAGTAVTGAFHAVSGATGLTITGSSGSIPSTSAIPATNGASFTVRFQINSSQYGIPKTYTYVDLPPGITRVSAKPDTLQGKPTRSGDYFVTVRGWEKANASGFTAEFSVLISVHGIAPVITQQPTNQTANVGDTVTFKVAATGEAPLSYQWLYEDLEINATEPTLTLANITTDLAGRYRVRVDSPAGPTFSEFATLTVVAPPPAQITQEPVDAVAFEGGPASFEVVATGAEPLTYAWLKDGFELGGDAIGARLQLGPIAANDAGEYQVRITNPGGDVFSRKVQLTVQPLVSPTLSSQPTSQRVKVGSPVTLSVTAVGAEPLEYFWMKDGQELGGTATNASLTLPAVTAADAGDYRVRVHNPGGDTLSDIASLAVEAAGVPPSILTQTGDLAVFPGEFLHLTVTVKGTAGDPPPTVIWQKDGQDLPASTGTSLSLGPVTGTTAGAYRAKVVGPGGTTLGTPIQLLVSPLPVLDTTQSLAGLKVGFSSVAGRSFVLEAQAALSEPWQVKQTLAATAARTEVLEPIAASAQYFRVRLVALP